ncbi:hypothetical protein [Dysgonomonas capnocytophagoides]|uniref:hypothetical protein n=1 Tax=Dysgonomonas capnocytophagoides TaxID=45254 RepID=UPI00291EF0D4|nr:hypothetical protein DCPSUM001_01310 [Dysgonomonas capnocytophagoides]
MKVKVLKIFRDIYTKELYSVGRKLEIEDEDRIEDLTSRGLVGVVEEEKAADPVLITLFEKEFEKKVVLDALKAIGEKVAWNMKSENIVANVAALDEEKTAALKTALGIE